MNLARTVTLLSALLVASPWAAARADNGPLLEIFEKRCAECHVEGEDTVLHAGINLANLHDAKGTAEEILERVKRADAERGRMPKSKGQPGDRGYVPPLTAEEIAVIEAFVKNGPTPVPAPPAASAPAALPRSADIVALCIGNDRYAKPEDMLDTPVADARLMKRTLEALPGGADVVLLEDASREDIVIELNSLAQRAQEAKLALVYYSGHGAEVQPLGGTKADIFLLPVEAELADVNDLPTHAVDLQTVLEALRKCSVTARAVILDSGRGNASRATAALKGSTKLSGGIDEAVPEATLVAIATGPGQPALAFVGENDENSPFTHFVAEALATEAGNLLELVGIAVERIKTATDKRQVPQVVYTGQISAIQQIEWRKAGTPTPPAPAEPEAVSRPFSKPNPLLLVPKPPTPAEPEAGR